MSSKVHGECRSFNVDVAVTYPKGARVKLDANGDLQLAGAAELAIGTMETTVTAAATNTTASVLLISAGVTRWMLASAAITAFTAIQAAAGGKIATGGTLGVALQAATADGDLIECLVY